MDVKKELKRLRDLQADHTRWFSSAEFDMLQYYSKIDSRRLLNLTIAELADMYKSLPDPIEWVARGGTRYYSVAYYQEHQGIIYSDESEIPAFVAQNFTEIRFFLNENDKRLPFWQLADQSVEIIVK